MRPFFVLVLSAALLSVAFARDDGRWSQSNPAKRQWFNDQKSPKTGMPCCNSADGEEVQEDIREGQYWIKGGSYSEWTPVPDDVVIKGPNKHGQPVVWTRFGGYQNGMPTGKPIIYCFAPGAGI